jgi:adenosylhomocysteine nucleosidase
MSRELLIITGLTCEAAPLREQWALIPMREDPIGERFQVFHRDGVYLAISGIGKVRSAIATASLLTWVTARGSSPVVANIGIAGASRPTLPLGSLVYINKVRDFTTNTRFYPDIIIKHDLPEHALDTYEHPVTTPPTEEVLVDMEGSGFMQAVTTLASPSSACILKVVSDYADGSTVTPTQVSAMIAAQASHIHSILSALQAELPLAKQLSVEDRVLLAQVIEHASLSLSQRIELTRRVEALSAQCLEYRTKLHAVLATPVQVKDQRNTIYHALLRELSQGSPL